jgi:hypothetical protein
MEVIIFGGSVFVNSTVAPCKTINAKNKKIQLYRF